MTTSSLVLSLAIFTLVAVALLAVYQMFRARRAQKTGEHSSMSNEADRTERPPGTRST